jgi:hypothetical protein
VAPRKVPLEERFAKWTRKTETGCWEWLGQTGGTHGYGYIKFNGKKQKAATVAYVWKKGPVPKGLEISHICPGGGNVLCVNPDHLIAETHSENLKRRRKYRYVFNCKHCGQPKEQVKNAWICVPCRASRAKDWRERTGYQFRDYYEANKDHINTRRRAWRLKNRRMQRGDEP